MWQMKVYRFTLSFNANYVSVQFDPILFFLLHFLKMLFVNLLIRFYFDEFEVLSAADCCCVSTEVLLDMRATGAELGWLTWPLEQGDRPGVSIQPSPCSSSSLNLLLEFAFRINLGENSRGETVDELVSSGAEYLTNI